MKLEATLADWYDRNGEGDNDHYSQPGALYRNVMNDFDRNNLVSNIAGTMKGISGPKRMDIINRQLCHFFRADMQLGLAIARALDVNVDAAMPKDTAHI